MMKITFLGTGTSTGVPIIACTCATCLSDNPKDQRLRTALLLEYNGTHIAIDIGPDFRQQMLRAKVSTLDAILITHEHKDHTGGLDDVRPFNLWSKKAMPVYATKEVQTILKQQYSYIFSAEAYPGAPRIDLISIDKNTPFEINSLPIVPIEVIHGKLPVLGFRIHNFTYITDAKYISNQELEKIKGTEYLVLNALHQTEHWSHLNLKEAIALAEYLQPKHTYFTHVSHRMGKHDEAQATLPPNISIAYDGLVLEV